MLKTAAITVTVSLLAGAAVYSQPELPEFPEPEPEHAWLQQLVGEWSTESEASLGEGQDPIKVNGTESIRSLGGFWIVGNLNADTPFGKPMSAVLTLGYDPGKKKYVGTWVDSMTSYMWKYEGTLDETGKILTLNTEGPNPAAPGEMGKFQDIIEIKSKDHRTLTSKMQTPDGEWVAFMSANYHRKK